MRFKSATGHYTQFTALKCSGCRFLKLVFFLCASNPPLKSHTDMLSSCSKSSIPGNSILGNMIYRHTYEYRDEPSFAHAKVDAFVTNDLQQDEDKSESSSFETRSQESYCECEFGTAIEPCEEDTAMPPPLPYYHRNSESSAPIKSGLARASSDQDLRRGARGKDLLWSPHMHQSMPNMRSFRPVHNRRMGSTVEFIRKKQDFASRVEEFEALLAGL